MKTLLILFTFYLVASEDSSTLWDKSPSFEQNMSDAETIEQLSELDPTNIDQLMERELPQFCWEHASPVM